MALGTLDGESGYPHRIKSANFITADKVSAEWYENAIEEGVPSWAAAFILRVRSVPMLHESKACAHRRRAMRRARQAACRAAMTALSFSCLLWSLLPARFLYGTLVLAGALRRLS